MFCFVVLLLLIGAGFYFYQKLMAIEAEIRAERDVECPTCVEPVQSDPRVDAAVATADVVPVPESEPSVSTVLVDDEDPVADTVEPNSLEAAILSAVSDQGGMKQTALYPLFVDTSKKQIQQIVKDLADKGLLRREKKGSSYLLYAA